MVQQIKMREDLKEWVVSGEKTATTRLGIKKIELGPSVILFHESKVEMPVEVTQVYQIEFKSIDKALATKENHTVESLKAALEHIYGPISDEQVLTVIEFKLLN